jgi:hypothetical protein
MWSRYQVQAPALVVIALLASGCDPGFAYIPVNENGTRFEEWSETIQGVRLATNVYQQLTPISVLGESLKVENNSNGDVVLVGARLELNGKSLESLPPKNREEEIGRTVPKGRSDWFYLDFDVSQLKDEERWDLGPSITWTWTVRIGREEHVVRVQMVRMD